MSLLKTIGNILQTTILRTKRSSKQITTDELLIATNEDLKRLFSDIPSNSSKEINLTIGGISQKLDTDRIWLWASNKYYIEVNESVTLPENYQIIISGELINEGEIINNGQLVLIL